MRTLTRYSTPRTSCCRTYSLRSSWSTSWLPCGMPSPGTACSRGCVGRSLVGDRQQRRARAAIGAGRVIDHHEGVDGGTQILHHAHLEIGDAQILGADHQSGDIDRHEVADIRARHISLDQGRRQRGLSAAVEISTDQRRGLKSYQLHTYGQTAARGLDIIDKELEERRVDESIARHSTLAAERKVEEGTKFAPCVGIDAGKDALDAGGHSLRDDIGASGGQLDVAVVGGVAEDLSDELRWSLVAATATTAAQSQQCGARHQP